MNEESQNERGPAKDGERENQKRVFLVKRWNSKCEVLILRRTSQSEGGILLDGGGGDKFPLSPH